MLYECTVSSLTLQVLSADPHSLPDRRSDLYVHLPSNNLCLKLPECFCSLTDVTFSLNIVALQKQGCMVFSNTWRGSTGEVTCVQRGTKVACFVRQEIFWRIGSLLTNTINPSSFACASVTVCWNSALPESPVPGLSLSDLPLPAAAAVEFVLVGEAGHEHDDGDDDCGGYFDVHSAIKTPVLDGWWDVNVNISFLAYNQMWQDMSERWDEGNRMAIQSHNKPMYTHSGTEQYISCQT